MRRWKAASAVTVAAAAALVLSACSGGSGGGTDQNGSSTDIKSMAVGKAENAQAGTFKLGDAPAWDGTVTVGIDDAFSAYNNQTPDTNSSYNTYVLIATLSGSSVIDGNNKVLLNNDVLDSWDVTSTNPYTVTYKNQAGCQVVRRRAVELQGLLPGLAVAERRGAERGLQPGGHRGLRPDQQRQVHRRPDLRRDVQAALRRLQGPVRLERDSPGAHPREADRDHGRHAADPDQRPGGAEEGR